MLKINIERLKKNILDLGEIGKDEQGGTTRLAYSAEYDRGVDLLKKLMEDASLHVETDSVGNVIGTRKGKSEKIILIGSHTDTVVHGGIFDGTLGVLGGIEALKTIDEAGIQLEHTIKVANWAEEEGNVIKGLIGSKSYIGEMDDSIVEIEEKLRQHGITADDIRNAKTEDLDFIESYLELHIEQGGVLFNKEKDIGVVTGIIGEERYIATLYGEENHAGTTPMNLRDDAMVKAAELLLELNQLCKETDETMVCTTGWIRAFPGEQNIIPGMVKMSIEIRAMKKASIKTMTDYIKRRFAEDECKLELTLSQDPVLMSDRCQSVIAEASDELGLSRMSLHSGAGHDAMAIAKVIKNTGMIFAPSVNGRSHCPQEWTEWHDVENSVNVLLNTILKMDQQKAGGNK